MDPVDVSIKWPFKWCLVGSSGSGKTNFALQIVSHANRIIDEPPSSVIIIYKEYQPIYDQFNNFIPTKCFREEEIDLEELTKNNQERLLIICDDLYFSQKLNEISEHFLIKARHRNISWLVLTQSIFNNSALKNISRNSTHITLFKSVRLNEPHIFFSQLRPKSSKVLQDIYSEATTNSYSYLDIDLSQTCPDKFRYKSNIFDKLVTVYIIMSSSTFKSMYLVGKNDIDKNSSKDFKLSLQNKDICDGGVNVSIKPVKKRQEKKSMGSSQQRMENSSGGKVYHDVDYGWKSNTSESKMQTDDNRDEDDLINEKKSIDHKKALDDWKMSAINDGEKKMQEFGPPSRRNWNKRSKITPQNAQRKAGAKKVAKFNFKKMEPRISNKRKHDDSEDIEYGSKFLHGEVPQETDPDSSLTVEGNLQDPTISKSSGQRDGNIDGNFEIGDDDPANEKLEDESDQWTAGLKSKLNDRRVQFKRKRDNVGYRINPELDDIAKSLVTPSDFKYMNETDSDEYLSRYKQLKRQDEKPYSIKRFKPYINGVV